MPRFDVDGETLWFWSRLGEEDIVVIVVVAVRGRSVMLVIAALDELGNFPISSNFFILDFRSSNSSHTVEGAVVETVEAVSLA